jgi:hypothetical protein
MDKVELYDVGMFRFDRFGDFCVRSPAPESVVKRGGERKENRKGEENEEQVRPEAGAKNPVPDLLTEIRMAERARGGN